MIKKRFPLFLVILTITALVLVSCQSNTSSSNSTNSTNSNDQSSGEDNPDVPSNNEADQENETTSDEMEEVTPSVTVTDQKLGDGTVTVAEVVSVGPGWIVIHAQADGKPGPILGYTAVQDGTNTNVVVKIDTEGATGTLYAMLHTDAGEVGTFEFPDGADGPVKVDDQVITPPFAVEEEIDY